MPLRQLVVIRFSAMGDVMLLVPVLKSLTAAYPDVEITVVTRPRFTAFFDNIERVKAFPADVEYQYNGILGQRALFKALLKRADFEMVFDLHDHLRTIILRTFFKLIGKPVIVFKKGRKEKKAFTQRNNRNSAPLPHTVARYQEAFQRVGFNFPIVPRPFLIPENEALKTVEKWLAQKKLNKTGHWIGIAPFSMHRSKTWPIENYAPLIQRLIQQAPDLRFFFFGGGQQEIAFFEDLQNQFPAHTTIVAGALKLRTEIALLKHIDLMLCVDSSNMHLAALSGTNLLSIWGGTHPDVGFAPYQCDLNSILQINPEELPCRPCSVYGKETCYIGEFPCLQNITPETVAERILQKLSPKK